MSNNEQQVKNSFIYLVPVIVGNLVPIVTLPIFTRILTAGDYGVLALAQIYAIFVSGIANVGLTNIYNRNYFQYREKKESAELLYSTLLFVGATLSVCAVVTFFYKAPLSRFVIGSPEHGRLLFWAFCANAMIGLKTYYFTYLRNSEEAKIFVRYTVYEFLLSVALSLYLVAYMKVGVIGLVWGQLLAGIVIFILLATRVLRILPVTFNWKVLKYSLKLGYPSTPSIFFKVVSNQFDKYMIGLMATVSAVVIYSIGTKIAYTVFAFMTAMENVFIPNMYKKMFDLGEKGGEQVGRYLTPFVYVSISIALLCSLFAEEVIIILTPESFHGAIDIVIILAMFYGTLFFGKMPQLIFAKKVFLSTLLNVSRVILNVAFNIPFIIKWGAIGAAWATLLSGLISGLIYFMVSQHYYEIKWEYKKIGAIFTVLFIAAISMILLRHFAIAYSTRLIVKFISITVFVYIGIKIKVITTENYRIVRNMIPLRKAA